MLPPLRPRASVVLALVLSVAGSAGSLYAVWTTGSPCSRAFACCLQVYGSTGSCRPLLARDPVACVRTTDRILHVAGARSPLLCRDDFRPP